MNDVARMRAYFLDDMHFINASFPNKSSDANNSGEKLADVPDDDSLSRVTYPLCRMEQKEKFEHVHNSQQQ